MDKIGKLTQTFKLLSKKLSKCDKERQRILHVIEVQKYDVVSGYKQLKQLQEVSKKRRIIKNNYKKTQIRLSAIRKGNSM